MVAEPEASETMHDAIEETLYIDAAIETVYAVISQPEHVSRWWPDEAHYEAVPGAEGTIVFRDPEGGHASETFTVLETTPPTRFVFRWRYPAGAAADATNSLLVVFELAPHGAGTKLTMTESGHEQVGASAGITGLRELHVAGWEHFLPRLHSYATSLAARP